MEKMEKKSNKETENIYEVLHTIGKKWSLELLELTKKTAKSYTELQKELGINSKLISAKLKEFIDLDLLRKEGDKYSLSKFGKKLMKNLKPVTKAISKFTKKGMEILKKENKKNKKKTSEVSKGKDLKKTMAAKVTTNIKEVNRITPVKKTAKKAVKKTTAKESYKYSKKSDGKGSCYESSSN
jgi:DNA-binding HxlR family transcriptional regulator